MKKKSIFAVEKIEAIRDGGKVRFVKLLIDGRCLFDEFYNEASKVDRHHKDILSILSMMNYMAETNALLPSQKFNSIKQGNSVIGYEFKKNDLRVYCKKLTNNLVVVFGGYKKNQKDDIKKLNRLVIEIEGLIEQLIAEKIGIL